MDGRVNFFVDDTRQDICRIGTGTDRVLVDHVLELSECDGIDIELPLKVLTSLSPSG